MAEVGDGAEDVAELRRRLSEAEETIQAIRDGEVDALVMRSADRDQVFSLAQGGESYRSFMEVMEIGAAAFDDTGRLLYVNAALRELICRPEGDLAELDLARLFGPSGGRAFSALLADASTLQSTAELVFDCAGQERHVVVSIAPLPLAFGTGRAVTFTDVTGRVEAEAAESSERVGQAVMASSDSAVVVCDSNGIVTHANLAVRGIVDINPVGQRFADVFAFEFPVGAGFIEASDVVDVGLAGNAVNGVEVIIPTAPQIKDALISVTPLRPPGGTTRGCAITMVDMTERKRAEKQQSLLMSELDHRVRNTLTLVLSIASRTIAGAADLKDFQTKFTRRIEALAATHRLLAGGSWSGLTIEDVVLTELSPYVAPGPRLKLGQLDVRVTPSTAVAIGLIIHELATNAVKYGALSTESGSVHVAGERSADGILEVTWIEHGGPRVAPPTHKGFGQTLIARSLGSAGGAGTTVTFEPEGVVCRMRIAAADIL